MSSKKQEYVSSSCILALGCVLACIRSLCVGCKTKKSVHRHLLNIRAQTCCAEGHRVDDTGLTQSPPQPSDRCSVTGNEEAVGEEEEHHEGPPSPAPAPLFLPHFSLFTSQECKSAKPPDLRTGSRWRWCRDLKSDPHCV